MVVAGCLAFLSSAQAAVVTPDSVTLQTQPGERVHQTVIFENDTDQTQNYGVNLLGVTFGASADDLRFVDLDAAEREWIDVSLLAFTLAPQATQAVEVTVNVPPDQSDQTLSFALLATTDVSGQSGVGVTSGVASIVFVNIGQELQPNLQIGSFDTVTAKTHRLPMKFALLVANTGPGLAQPDIALVIKNFWGREVKVISLNPLERRVPSMTNRVFSADWEGGPWHFGPYTVQAYVFPDDSAAVLTSSMSVVLFPWQMLVVLAVAGLSLSGAIALYWRARRP